VVSKKPLSHLRCPVVSATCKINAYQDQLETMQQAMQQCHATSLNYDQHISVLQENGFPVP